MEISAWAFTDEKNQIKVQKKHSDILKKIATIEGIEIDKISQYAKTRFKGTLETKEAKALTEYELAVYADSGNLCFGGFCKKSGNRFSGAYYTD